MSADAYIAIVDPARLPFEILKAHLDNDYSSFFKKFPYDSHFPPTSHIHRFIMDEYYETDKVWIGQVSWFSFNKEELLIPKVVERVKEIYDARGGIVQITEGLIPMVTTAFNLPHTSFYETPFYEDGAWKKRKGINKARTVKKFMSENIGKYSYFVSD